MVPSDTQRACQHYALLEMGLYAASAAMAQTEAAFGVIQREISASREEIERLRDDLSRARNEALVESLTRIVNRRTDSSPSITPMAT